MNVEDLPNIIITTTAAEDDAVEEILTTLLQKGKGVQNVGKNRIECVTVAGEKIK